jgi:import inner membrane translocase subunit TIM50
MSFLLPSVRHSLRHQLRNNVRALCPQIIPRLHPLVRTMGAHRAYSQANGNNQGPRQTPQSQQSNPAKDQSSQLKPGKDPKTTPSPEDSLPAESKSSKSSIEDLPTGDIHATPGSILAQYTSSPQEQAGDLATTESESGLPKRGEYISSTDRKRERMARIFMWGFLFGLVGGGIYLGRPLETEERERMGWGNVPLDK